MKHSRHPDDSNSSTLMGNDNCRSGISEENQTLRSQESRKYEREREMSLMGAEDGTTVLCARFACMKQALRKQFEGKQLSPRWSWSSPSSSVETWIREGGQPLEKPVCSGIRQRLGMKDPGRFAPMGEEVGRSWPAQLYAAGSS